MYSFPELFPSRRPTPPGMSHLLDGNEFWALDTWRLELRITRNADPLVDDHTGLEDLLRTLDSLFAGSRYDRMHPSDEEAFFWKVLYAPTHLRTDNWHNIVKINAFRSDLEPDALEGTPRLIGTRNSKGFMRAHVSLSPLAMIHHVPNLQKFFSCMGCLSHSSYSEFTRSPPADLKRIARGQRLLQLQAECLLPSQDRFGEATWDDLG